MTRKPSDILFIIQNLYYTFVHVTQLLLSIYTFYAHNTVTIYHNWLSENIRMDNKAVYQPMVTDEPQNEVQNSNIHPLTSDHMNISVAFKEIVSKDPPRYTKFLEAVNKTFEEISDCVG